MEKTEAYAGKGSSCKTDTNAGAPMDFDFIAIVDSYETPLLRYAGLLLAPDQDGCEEVVQEAFLRLHRQTLSGNHAEISNLEQWLFRVVHNCACDALRKRRLNRKACEQAAATSTMANGGTSSRTAAIDRLVDAELREHVIAEVQNLDVENRQVLLLKVIRGFTFREIAEITGLSVGNVSYRLDRALRELAQRLKNAGLI